MKSFGTAITVLVLLAVAGVPAQAAVYETPAPGATVGQANAAVFFDWTWELGEYASSIYFCTTPAPEDPCWNAPARQTPEQRTSSAQVDFRPFPTGTWYWRLCVKSIYSEEDVCYVQSIRRITVVAGPGPPQGPVAPTTAPTLSKSQAQRSSRKALKEEFGNRFSWRRSFEETCRRRSRTSFSCRVAWSLSRGRAYSGKVTVRSTLDGVRTRISVRPAGRAA